MKKIIFILTIVFYGCVYSGNIQNSESDFIKVNSRDCIDYSKIKIKIIGLSKLKDDTDRFRYFDEINVFNNQEIKFSKNKNILPLKKDNLTIEVGYSEDSDIDFSILNFFGVITSGILPIKSKRVSVIDVKILDETNKKSLLYTEKFSWNAYFAIWGGLIYPFSNVEKTHNKILLLSIDNAIYDYCKINAKVKI